MRAHVIKRRDGVAPNTFPPRGEGGAMAIYNPTRGEDCPMALLGDVEGIAGHGQEDSPNGWELEANPPRGDGRGEGIL